MLPMMSMSSLGNAGIAWLLLASSLVHLVVCWLSALWFAGWFLGWILLDLAMQGWILVDSVEQWWLCIESWFQWGSPHTW
jgi:hypothetical protein